MEPPAKRRRLELDEVVAPSVIERPININGLILNPHCLARVLALLPSKDLVLSTEVCRYWRHLQPEIWWRVRRLDLITIEKFINPSSFKYIKNYRQSAEFEMNLDERFTTKYPRLLSLCGKFLTTLTIPVPETFDILQIAIDECQNLRKVIIRFEDFDGRSRYSEDIGELIEKNRRTLRSVTIDNMGPEFFNSTEYPLIFPEKLNELVLWGYKAHFARFKDRDEFTRSFYRVVPTIQRLRNLQILVLNGFDISGNDLKMIENFEELKYLEILRGKYCFDVYNIDAISSRRKLEYLCLQRVYNMHDRWFADLVRNNPNLKHLKFQTCKLEQRFIVNLFSLSTLKTLSLTYLTVWPRLTDLSGFHNLEKFVCTQVGDQAVIELMEVAPKLKLVNLREAQNPIQMEGNEITPRVLYKAQEVTSQRRNGVKLRIIVEGKVIQRWKRPKRISPLLTVESSKDYERRSRYGYEGNDEELFYWNDM